MDDIVLELGRLDERIQTFAPEAHWFCPKTSDNDFVNYWDPDVDEESATTIVKRQRIDEALMRQHTVYHFMRIFGCDAGDPQVEAWQRNYMKRLTELLEGCDKCVKSYHMDRKRFLSDLAEQYDEDTVNGMSNLINTIDFDRIDRGMHKAKEVLSSIPESQRSTSALGRQNPTALQALYEALCCSAFLDSKGPAFKRFDDIFHMVQTSKVLVLGDIVPATARYLFDADVTRQKFAIKGWTSSKTNQTITEDTFNWSIHDALTAAIESLILPTVQPSDVRRFWAGFIHIAKNLDESLIIHSLRAMDIQPDVYHLALQSMAHQTPEILDVVIQTVCLLIEKSPKAFWDAYGSISPTTVAEQIFASPAYPALLSRLQHRSESGDEEDSIALAWISPFIRSLRAGQQFEACRTVLSCLFDRFQETKFPKESQNACIRTGLETLSTTLNTFAGEKYIISASTSFIMINNVLGLVDKFKSIIIMHANMTPKYREEEIISKLGLDVIRLCISLNCKAFRAEYLEVSEQHIVHHGLGSHTESMWNAILDSFRPDNMALAKHILNGIAPLNGLDKFRQWRKTKDTRKLLPLTTDEIEFNKEFEPLVELISRIFQRLSDFTPENLRELCRTPKVSIQIFAGLMPALESTYESAVEIIKTVTGEETRRDAISKLLQDSLEQTLASMSQALNGASALETFAAYPYIIKTSRDTLGVLCDAQDGILRARTALTASEQHAIKVWWKVQWKAMASAFRMCEQWSLSQSSKIMTDFVRDTMDYSESLFDQYSVLASALNSTSLMSSGAGPASRDICVQLLEEPRKAMGDIAKWLRLKDPYLVASSTSLVSKLLRRLGEFNIEVHKDASRYVEMTISQHVKTVLTGQQKAELQRALDEHEGFELMDSAITQTATKSLKPGPGVSKSKNGVIDVESWAKNARKAPSAESELNDDIRSLSRNVEQNRSILDQVRLRHTGTSSTAVKPNNAIRGESIKESREREKKAKAARDASIIAQARSLRGESAALVAGEGSGLQGLGIAGKQHTHPTAEIMVSSSEEDDDDEEAGVSALIAKRKQASKRGAEYTIKPQAHEGPVRKQKIIRSAKDMRARLVPNMNVLHQAILEWDIFHEGEDPPRGPECQDVANKFRDPLEYRNTFLPLLIAEAWRSFKSAKEENTLKPFEIKVVNRMSVDQFYEISTSSPISVTRDIGIMDGDIVLLSKGLDPMRDSKEPHCLARVHRTTRKKEVLEVSYRISGQASTGNSLPSMFAPNLNIRGMKITSMTTIEREYAALHSLQYYDLCDEVLKAKPSPLLRYPAQELGKIEGKYELNTGQAKAVMSAADNDGFTLIQGPPGSGKTKTIVAMVGALLTNSFVDVGVAVGRPIMNGAAAPNKPVQKKLLVCAPSNAAVDELVARLKIGIKTLKGETHKINVVRLGRSDAINSNVRDVTLDELVNKALEGESRGNKIISERDKLHQRAGQLKQELAQLRPKLEEARTMDIKDAERRLQREFDEKKREQARLGAKIDEDKDSGNTVARDNEIRRRLVLQKIIDGAHVLCSTLSGSGHEMFKNLNVEFETVIIDEAAQCIELSALIPLKYGCTKCILVGDPKQLPPTVLSRSAASYGYEQSLFVRMQKNHPDDVHLLDTQYRMHPEISIFPSQQFYDGKLIDGPNMAALRRKPWHGSSILGPYTFFDVKGTQTSGARGHSFINQEELNVALQLYERLRIDFSTYDFRGKIGIITPYKAQLGQLRSRFQQKYGDTILEDIDFNTTDSFQGRESEIIIFSCVRARASGGIGFLEDIRRMNVGLTRAKSSLWVLGDSRSLIQGQFWAKLLADAKSRDRYVEGDVLSLLRKPISRAELQTANGFKQSPGPNTIKLEPKPTNAPVDAMEGVVMTSTTKSTNSSHDELKSELQRMQPKSRKEGKDDIPKKPASKPVPVTDKLPLKRPLSSGAEMPVPVKAKVVGASLPRPVKPATNDISVPLAEPQRPMSSAPAGWDGAAGQAARGGPPGPPKIIRARPPADPLRRHAPPKRPK